MKAKSKVILSFGALIFLVCGSGCNTTGKKQTLPAPIPVLPNVDQVAKPDLMPIPVTPENESIPITVVLEQTDPMVSNENAIMRRGLTIKSGSSVVISVPQAEPDTVERTNSEYDFKTDGYFNILEQYIERGLLSVGLQVKDRSKFEQKLRDLRGGDGDSSGANELQGMVDLLIAAQDGDVMADYILQVNDGVVERYTGEPLQLGKLPVVQEALLRNPGLRVGNIKGKTIPSTLKQAWWLASFNGKLINSKTGSIDWIGDYSIESLAASIGGIQITIGVRRYVANSKEVMAKIDGYNNSIQKAYQDSAQARKQLVNEYERASQEISWEGDKSVGQSLKNRVIANVSKAKENYQNKLHLYRSKVNDKPPSSDLKWVYDFTVDTPIISPDFLKTDTDEEKRFVDGHIKRLADKVTRELLQTVVVD
jgi:hypothetical protein